MSDRVRALLRFALALAFVLALVFTLHADAGPPRLAPAVPTTPAATPPPPSEEHPVAQDSPRAAVTQFLDDCHAQRFEEAAKWLDIPHEDADRSAELAQRLAAVLDRHTADLDTLSGESAGDLDDGQRRTLETIAAIPMPEGKTEPVRMVRRGKPAGWVFGRGAVARIDAWYARLPNRWLLDHLPRYLLRPGPGPLELPLWQWIAIPLSLLAAWMIGFGIGLLTRWLIVRALRNAGPRWQANVFKPLRGPLVFAWTLVVWRPLLGWLGLAADTLDVGMRLDRAGLLLALFWALLRIGDIAAQLIVASRWAVEHPSSRSLVRLGTRLTKAAVVAIAIVAFLSELGLPVTSLIAGLGIGGLAIALAAQKTVENLFGAFSLGADQPFREGDLVKVEDFLANVERIGLRSTRFRTQDRTLITIPNGKLAEARLETYGVRDRVRLHAMLGLARDTEVARVREVVAAIEALLRSHPKIWPEQMTIALAGFGESSLDVEVTAWFLGDAIEHFPEVRHEVLLGILERVEAAGCRLAVPMREVKLDDRRA